LTCSRRHVREIRRRRRPHGRQARHVHKQMGMGTCGCCKNMAMMDGMKADDPHKGMDMPKQ
ncbi:hypothetical protein ABTM91_21000, partial [Acinetobacter baumannii]